MAKVPPITGVAEIVLSVRDVAAMKDFYQSVLGFELLSEACHESGPEPDPVGEPTIAFLTIKQLGTPLGVHGHPQLLVLIDFRRHVFAKQRFEGHDPARSTLNHLAFEIPPETYEVHRVRLEALGLQPRSAAFPAMRARALFFNDPEQNVLELICHDPAMRGLANPSVDALEPELQPDGLLETALFVENLPRARDFYQQVVGLEKRQESEFGCVFVVAKGQLLLLISQEKARIPSVTPGGTVPACLGESREARCAGHLAFTVPKVLLQAWRGRLESKGVKVLSEVTWDGGACSLYFRDPDGHLLELATSGLWGLDW